MGASVVGVLLNWDLFAFASAAVYGIAAAMPLVGICAAYILGLALQQVRVAPYGRCLWRLTAGACGALQQVRVAPYGWCV